MLAGCNEKPAAQKKMVNMAKAASNITIVDVYDNVEFNPSFKTGFGFGCVVKLKDKNILFDTGGDSPTLLLNLGKAGIKPESIGIVVLSHIHGDHTGGLAGFLEKNHNVTVYAPESFPASFKNDITSAGAKLVEISESAEITEGVYSTGELGTMIKEQSLIISSGKGLVVITGCAHPGIADIIRTAKELMGRDVYLAMGGFHHPPASIVDEFREIGVKKAAPSHCTGEPASSAFEKEYKGDFIKSGVGKIIKI